MILKPQKDFMITESNLGNYLLTYKYSHLAVCSTIGEAEELAQAWTYSINKKEQQ